MGDVAAHGEDGLAPGDPLADESRADPGSFEAFFASEYRKVFGLMIVLSGQRAMAEELAQDAFMAAFRDWRRISMYDEPGAWVRRVAINLATSSWRRRVREARALLSLSRRREVAPEQMMDDTAFWEAVRALPLRQSQCIALRYAEDRPTSEIAAVLGIAEATVRVHLHAGRSALAARLGEAREEGSSDG